MPPSRNRLVVIVLVGSLAFNAYQAFQLSKLAREAPKAEQIVQVEARYYSFFNFVKNHLEAIRENDGARSQLPRLLRRRLFGAEEDAVHLEDWADPYGPNPEDGSQD